MKNIVITLLFTLFSFTVLAQQNSTEQSKKPASKSKKVTFIDFTLANTSAKSIPLIIPTVMNPNLSPFSRSGVGLKIGQVIYFKNKGRKYILLTVTDEIKNGDVLNVPELIKKRKIELGLK